LDRVCVIHNRYQQTGGEDAVVNAEVGLLRANGHQVETLERSNDAVQAIGSLGLAVKAHWAQDSANDLKRLIQGFKPDVVHVHNTMPLISPAVIWAASHAGVPVVQTLHNFRLSCINGLMLRDEKPCEKCVGKSPLSGVLHRCYRNSYPASFVLASATMFHRLIQTYTRRVDAFIALSQFSRNKMIQAGLPQHKLVVKPNFVADPGVSSSRRRGLVYVGRLSEEKGIRALAQMMRQIEGIDLSVYGDGPKRGLLEGLANVKLFGRASHEEVLGAIAAAQALILPSICYENFPRTLVEAFACGTPVLVSRAGSLAELVTEGVNGFSFIPNDENDMLKVTRAAFDTPQRLMQMGEAARRCYEQHFVPDLNYQHLVAIYQAVKVGRTGPAGAGLPMPMYEATQPDQPASGSRR
jgi:glycosyltransferase involved in cell wall biosynthesis